MAGAKLVVLYPHPSDVDAFERAYIDEHIPMAQEGIAGATKLVLAKALGAPKGAPAFHRVAEIYFESLEALQRSLATPSTQAVAQHAVSISSGGPPVFLVCEEQVVTSAQAAGAG
jgi:uncharacterized protein (TIGR02118 family)